jgi:hypothetical protein
MRFLGYLRRDKVHEGVECREPAREAKLKVRVNRKSGIGERWKISDAPKSKKS